jgi:hypothetical protein
MLVNRVLVIKVVLDQQTDAGKFREIAAEQPDFVH